MLAVLTHDASSLRSRFAPAFWATLILARLLAPGTVVASCPVVISSSADSGAGSLRQAIIDAAPGSGICISSGLTITLLSQIAIGKNLTITSVSSPPPVLSGGGTNRIFEIQSPAVVALSDIVIRDGLVSSVAGGGGVRVDGGATLTMTACTVTACSSGVGGGAIRNGGTLTLDRCTLNNNTATANFGGAIDNVFGGHLTMTNCTVTGNTSASAGGAIDNYGAGSTAAIHSSTIAYNTAVGNGGGIYTAGGDADAVALDLTILYGNTSAATGPDCNGTLVSELYNMYGSLSGCTRDGTATNDLVGVDPKLGALEYNGGDTRTMALDPSSVAIDRMPNVFGGCSQPVDQRGETRPQDGDANGPADCDIGAYEATRPIVVTSLADPGDGTTCTLRQAVSATNTNANVGTCASPVYHGSSMPDRITFGVTGTTVFPGISGYYVSESVIVDGPGPDKLTIDAFNGDFHFHFAAGTGSNVYVVRGLTMKHGRGLSLGGSIEMSNAPNDTLAVDRCLMQDNSGMAGVIHAQNVLAVDIARSTIVNSSNGTSGVVLNDTDATMTNCTIDSGNTAAGSAGAALTATGSGAKAKLTVTNSTIAGPENYGISVSHDASADSAVVILDGNIVSGHTTQLSATNGGTFVSRGHNVISDASGPAATNGDLKSTDPMLNKIAYNGGPTPTFNPKHGSPAVDLIPLASLTTGVDQRGIPRAVGAGGDAGAVERYASGDANGDGMLDVADVFYVINFLFAGGPSPVGEADANGDGTVDVADVFYIINNLFAGGPGPV